MRKAYVTDVFSVRMLTDFPIKLIIDRVDKTEFCYKINSRMYDGELVSAIRYSNSAKMINILCNIQIEKNRMEIRLNKGDELYVILPKMKPDDRRELSKEEVEQMYREGRIEFYEVLL
jgi:NhaP-type Na+/H+ and K+/H+ antiporter